MRIALRELRRRPSRFATATIILTLIAILLMFLGGLLDGLVQSATGAVRAQDADVIVYSSTARESFFRSRIPPELQDQVAAVPGVGEVGGLGVALLGGRVPGPEQSQARVEDEDGRASPGDLRDGSVRRDEDDRRRHTPHGPTLHEAAHPTHGDRPARRTPDHRAQEQAPCDGEHRG